MLSDMCCSIVSQCFPEAKATMPKELNDEQILHSTASTVGKHMEYSVNSLKHLVSTFSFVLAEAFAKIIFNGSFSLGHIGFILSP